MGPARELLPREQLWHVHQPVNLTECLQCTHPARPMGGKVLLWPAAPRIEGDLLRLNVEPAFFVSKPEPICTSLERSLPEFDFKVNIDTEARFEFGLLDLGSSRVKGIMGICEGCRR